MHHDRTTGSNLVKFYGDGGGWVGLADDVKCKENILSKDNFVNGNAISQLRWYCKTKQHKQTKKKKGKKLKDYNYLQDLLYLQNLVFFICTVKLVLQRIKEDGLLISTW